MRTVIRWSSVASRTVRSSIRFRCRVHSAIVFDPAGERMAVLHAGGVTIVDAADGGNPEFWAGKHVSLAFRPGNNENFAYSEVIEEGASYSIGVNAGFPIAVGASIPAIDGVRISPPELA